MLFKKPALELFFEDPIWGVFLEYEDEPEGFAYGLLNYQVQESLAETILVPALAQRYDNTSTQLKGVFKSAFCS